eukprot:gnl/TRDRNA2_/TRDRNA2_133196_c1_seq1.p1 gnl/TRDRNA2_/TRDRNA2_133196_c1~~gnl/TRDRNA2_/TRDRNA2_133196_c1_seq1.p1  ORF type:complete len:721 (-),score=106.39 gnl/TRDRNA2_/TRDRNA2_133196_c1_seq1:31-2193(-)
MPSPRRGVRPEMPPLPPDQACSGPEARDISREDHHLVLPTLPELPESEKVISLPPVLQASLTDTAAKAEADAVIRQLRQLILADVQTQLEAHRAQLADFLDGWFVQQRDLQLRQQDRLEILLERTMPQPSLWVATTDVPRVPPETTLARMEETLSEIHASLPMLSSLKNIEKLLPPRSLASDSASTCSGFEKKDLWSKDIATTDTCSPAKSFSLGRVHLGGSLDKAVVSSNQTTSQETGIKAALPKAVDDVDAVSAVTDLALTFVPSDSTRCLSSTEIMREDHDSNLPMSPAANNSDCQMTNGSEFSFRPVTQESNPSEHQPTHVQSTGCRSELTTHHIFGWEVLVPAPPNTFIGRIVTGHQFERISATVILVNAVFLGYQAEHTITHLETPTTQGITLASWIFCLYYLLEVILKLAVYKQYYFINHDWRWHWFDLLLVITSTYDQATQLIWKSTGAGAGGAMQLLRLLRLAKMLRMVRAMRFYRELRILLMPIMGSVRQLCWTLCMLMLIMYIFACIFLQAVGGVLLDDIEDRNLPLKERAELLESWGSVLKSMLSLYKAITGGADWGDLAEPLKHAGYHYYLLFLFYVSFLTFAVLNVLTGIFVDVAMKCSEDDPDSGQTRDKTEAILSQQIMKLVRGIGLPTRRRNVRTSTAKFETLLNMQVLVDYLDRQGFVPGSPSKLWGSPSRSPWGSPTKSPSGSPLKSPLGSPRKSSLPDAE